MLHCSFQCNRVSWLWRFEATARSMFVHTPTQVGRFLRMTHLHVRNTLEQWQRYWLLRLELCYNNQSWCTEAIDFNLDSIEAPHQRRGTRKRSGGLSNQQWHRSHINSNCFHSHTNKLLQLFSVGHARHLPKLCRQADFMCNLLTYNMTDFGFNK